MSTEQQLLRELRHLSIRVEDLLAANARLTTEIEELREGKCRYNCRTAKVNYMAGFENGRYGHVTSKEAWHEHRTSS